MYPFVIIFFNSIVFVIYCFLGSYIILRKKKSGIKKIVIAVISLILMYYYILCLLDSIYAMFFSGVCAFLFIKIIFNESLFTSIFVSLILTTTKTLFKICVLQILNNDSYLLYNTFKTISTYTFLINLISIILSLIIVFLLRRKIRKFISYSAKLKYRKILLFFVISINFVISFLYQPPYNGISINLIADTIIIIGVTTVVIFIISNEMKMENLMEHYQEIYEYSKTNDELLKQYKMQVHEDKNKLLMIREMLDSSVKETKKYVDSLLKEIKENNTSTNYWVTELQNIPLPGIRNFINYKLTKMKNLKAHIEVFVDSELTNIDPSTLYDKEYNQLTTILGVILDNMIDSIKETPEKLVSMYIHLQDDKIHCEFVNSYLGEIDLNRLNEVGYTTKGEQHGVGLPLVSKIIKSNERFDCKPSIIDNFFTQHLTIKLFNKKNLPKKSKK